MLYKFLLKQLLYDAYAFYIPRIEIEIDNDKLNARMEKTIIDVSVEEKIGEGAGFTMTVNDEFDTETQTFKWLDHELFNVGNTVTIKMGYQTNPMELPVVGTLLSKKSSLETFLMGNITGLEPSFFAGETPTITVKGQDLSYDYIKRKCPEKTFIKMSYSDIVKKIANDAGLTPKVDKTEKYAPSVRKKNDESYFSFLEKLAGEVDYQFKIDRRDLYFKKPADDKQEELTLELGKDIISFHPGLSTAGLYPEVEVRGHNPADPGTPIVGRAKAGSERSQESGRQTGSQVAKKYHNAPKKVITNVIVKSAKHADAIASAALNRASDGFIEGDVQCVGRTEIRPGICIKLDKLGKRFSGKYYVTAAVHTFDNNGYRTRFTVKRNAL